MTLTAAFRHYSSIRQKANRLPLGIQLATSASLISTTAWFVGGQTPPRGSKSPLSKSYRHTAALSPGTGNAPGSC